MAAIMRTLLFLFPFLPACAPLTPEGRAYMAAHLQQQAQRDHERGMVNQWQMQQALHSPFQRQREHYPTYYARPDPIYPGGTIYSPRRFGY